MYLEYLLGKGVIVLIVLMGMTVSVAAAEIVVVAVNFLFFGLVECVFVVVLILMFVSGFYVMMMMIEGCRYLCGYMNLLMVIVSYALAGDLKSREVFEVIASYVIGGIVGFVIVVIVVKVFVFELKSVKCVCV